MLVVVGSVWSIVVLYSQLILEVVLTGLDLEWQKALPFVILS